MNYCELNPETLALAPFFEFDQNWALLSAGPEEDFNTMTIGWGMLGSFWTHAAVTVYVRDSRYTKTYLDNNERFSVSFFCRPEESHKDLLLLGTKSGRDGDKLAETKLHPVFVDGLPCYEEAKLTLLCRKVAASRMDEKDILSDAMYKRWYSGKEEGDFHTAYIGFIEKAFRWE